VRAVSTNVAPPRLLFGLPLDAGVDASKNPPFWTDATKIREEPSDKDARSFAAGGIDQQCGSVEPKAMPTDLFECEDAVDGARAWQLR